MQGLLGWALFALRLQACIYFQAPVSLELFFVVGGACKPPWNIRGSCRGPISKGSAVERGCIGLVATVPSFKAIATRMFVAVWCHKDSGTKIKKGKGEGDFRGGGAALWLKFQSKREKGSVFWATGFVGLCV